MTPTEKYRNSKFHRKCQFCIYYKYRCFESGCGFHELYECLAKDKYINFPNLIRFLCPLFTLNTKDCKEVDDKVNKLLNAIKEDK